MAALLLFTVGCLLVALWAAIASRRITHPVSILTGIWCLVGTFYLADAQLLYPVDGDVLRFVSIGLTSTVLGITLGRLSKNAPKGSDVSGSMYVEPKLARLYLIANVALTGYIGLQLFRVWPLLQAAGGLSGIFSTSTGLDFRRSYLSQRISETQSGFGDGGLFMALLGYVLFAGAVSLVIAGHYAAVGRFTRASYPLILMASYSLIILERASFLYSAGIFFFSYAYHRRNVRHASVARLGTRGKWTILVAGALVALVAFVPAALRSEGAAADHEGGQGGVASYVYAGLAGLNGAARVQADYSTAHTGVGSPVYGDRAAVPLELGSGHGIWTFQGAASIASRLGWDADLPSGLRYVATGPSGGNISNVYSFLIYLWFDWGWFGVVAGGLLLGWICGRADLLARRGRAAWIGPASILMTTLLMSFFGLALIRDVRYLFLGVVCLIALRRAASDSAPQVRAHG